MKKAKPIKGSARTRKFASGGDIAALAGLGTLAYLMSRKKDKEEGGLKAKGTDLYRAAEEADVAPRARAEDTEMKPLGKFPAEPGYGTSGGAPEEKAAPKAEKKSAPVVKQKSAAPKQGAYKEAPVIEAGKKSKEYPIKSVPSEERPSKPYPEKQAQSRKLAAEVLRKTKEASDMVKKASKIRPKSGMGPANTFLTEERLEKARKSMKGGFDKGLFERGDLGIGKKKGGAIKKYAAGGSISSASKRADGIAQRGKTRGKVL